MNIRHINELISAWSLRIFHPASMIRWLTALSLTVTSGMLFLGGSILWDLRAEAWHRSEQGAENLVLALSQDIARNITLYDLSLQGVIQALAEPALAAADPKVRQLALFDTAGTAEYLGSMLVVDAQGKIIESSAARKNDAISMTSREHFSIHQQRPDVGLFISRVFTGRLVAAPMIALTRRLTNPDGSFAGIVEGAMRIDYFRDLFAKLDIGARGSVVLFRADGRIIMRRPYRVADIDQDLSGAPTFHEFMGLSHGHFVGTAALDGVQRLYTFNHIENLPLILSVALSLDDIYADWWRKATSIGAILTLLCGISVGLCLLFRQELLRRMAAERQLQDAAHSLSVMAATDGLTGIPNRRFYEDALAQEWRRAIRAETSVGLMMMDVDCFKLFNDTYGHQSGDEVLRAVGSCICRTLHRPADRAARYGGEEFVALLPETELEGVLTVAEAIRAAVENLGIPHAHGPTGVVSISIGVSVMRPTLGDVSATLVQQADEALYEAKRFGRNRVVSRAAQDIQPDILACLRPDTVQQSTR